jgi:hypothetical protein
VPRSAAADSMMDFTPEADSAPRSVPAEPAHRESD